MKNISIYNPSKVAFGAGCLDQLVNDCIDKNFKRIFICTIDVVTSLIQPQLDALKKAGIGYTIDTSINNEPDFNDFYKLLKKAKVVKPDSVVGIGGGSVLDIAKILATLVDSNQTLPEVAGNGLIKNRTTHLACCPTTSGTGSEVSPNSILVNDDGDKIGIISPFLVPDVAYVDPNLTLNLPASITAFTGIDAFIHCLEAYTNVNAHPFIDAYAMKGISLIYNNLPKAIIDGQNIEARSNVALGSMLGGMCLGPVNTAAIHALAYPIGTQFKIAHGLSNAVLTTSVIEYNMAEVPKRYAEIARVLGADEQGSDTYMALNGLQKIKKLLQDCNIPDSLSDLGIKTKDISSLTKSAMNVQRLLKNNPRKIELEDAVKIYESAF